MSYDIVPANLAITAMRSNGFKSTDYAISELIDNSIQAGMHFGNEVSHVEVLCVEKRSQQNGALPRIQEIIIADDSGGMTPDVLRRALMFGAGTNLTPDRQKGMGKFGMGLPNASISQCKLVEVYSWQNGKCYTTSLDVNRIEQNEIREVPEPKETKLPDRFKELSNLANSEAGTIVVWKELDKTTWVTHKGFFRNSEFLVGRMYRKFIDDGKVEIKLKAFTQHPDGQIDLTAEMYVRPNDPLMLMKGTSAPPPYDKEPAFIEMRERNIEIKLNDGVTSNVKFRFSFGSAQARKKINGVKAGSLPHGKYAARNLGVSIVRADRELELNTTWVTPGVETERWWGIEISFQPELDEIFGVTNNKQAALNLYRADPSEDAANLGIKQSEHEQQLLEAGDLRQHTYKISAIVDSMLRDLRSQVKKQNEGEEIGQRNGSDEAEQLASDTTKRRQIEGTTSESDEIRANATDEERMKAIAEGYQDAGVSEEDAKRIAIEKIADDVRFNFIKTGLGSAAIFEVSSEMGEYFIKFNHNHDAYAKFIELIEANSEADKQTNIGLKLLLCAWARMEDEATNTDKDKIQDIRVKWGQYARDYLSNDD